MVGVLTTLATSISAVIKDAETINQMKKLNKQNAFFENDNFITLQNDLVINYQAISNIFATHRRYVSDRIADFNDYIISEFIRQCETEVLTVLSGGIPLAKDWIRDFNSVCLKVNKQSFCSKIALSSFIRFESTKFTLNQLDGSLELSLNLIMPIEGEHFSSYPLTLYEGHNIGFFSDSAYMKILVPERFIVRVIKDPNNGSFAREIIELTRPCERDVCFSTDLVITHRCKCAASIFLGKFDQCSYTKMENQSPCELLSLNNEGVLVAAQSAIFKEKSEHFEQKEQPIKNATIRIKKTGRLLCERNGLTTVHNINSKTERKFESYRDLVQVFDLEANISDLHEIENNFQKMQNRVTDLEKFNKNEFAQVGDNSITHESIINFGMIMFIGVSCVALITILYKKIMKKFLTSFD